MSRYTENQCEYSDVLVALHKSEVSREDLKLWEMLALNQKSIRDFYSKLYLDVHIDEEEGYAFLKSKNSSHVGEDESDHPRLMRRVELSKSSTLLMFLLREALFNFDNSHQESLALVVSRKEIRDMMIPYTDFQADEVKFVNWVNHAIEAVSSLGFLKALRENDTNQDLHVFEVRRILKARVSAEQLKAMRDLFPASPASSTDSIEQSENL